VRRETPRTATGTVAVLIDFLHKKMFQNGAIKLDLVGFSWIFAPSDAPNITATGCDGAGLAASPLSESIAFASNGV
jgi:hypothetical protein